VAALLQVFKPLKGKQYQHHEHTLSYPTNIATPFPRVSPAAQSSPSNAYCAEGPFNSSPTTASHAEATVSRISATSDGDMLEQNEHIGR